MDAAEADPRGRLADSFAGRILPRIASEADSAEASAASSLEPAAISNAWAPSLARPPPDQRAKPRTI
ncbi:hypothetical protein HMPREF0972_02128 [Actinomyces sp. oral taxon 848 str. F0332]|nr:hypothetical protein HMPREF0972_02128 [Actinomyces sp. oral taxon 848 str. F0332]